MFDLQYKESVGFVSYAAAMKAKAGGCDECTEEAEEAKKAVEELSETVSEQNEAVAENSAAIADNKAAIAENATAIAEEATAREGAVNELNDKIDSIPGTDIDLSDYAKLEDLDAKANADDVYTKAEADAKFVTEQPDISSLATKEELSGVTERVSTLESEYASVDEKLVGLAEANLAQDTVIATKADDLEMENKIYVLTQLVGDLGGAVTYELPSPAGKSFNALMSNNGTVKLVDDVETGRFGPGVMAKNTVKLNLNGHNLSFTGTGNNGAIMARGTEQITIYGKGTIDGGELITIQGNGADSVINLTGSTTVYRNSRNGGELVYCYAGTINITNGTFRMDSGSTGYLLNCYDANYKNGTAKIIVSSASKTSGPKFYDFNPADNSAEGEHTSFVAEGCEVVVSTVTEDEVEHTVYMVVKSAE